MPWTGGLEARRKWFRERREKRKQAGLCIRCGGPRTDERISCNDCAKRENGYVEKIVTRHLENGKCRCGKDYSEGRLTCEKCADLSASILRDFKVKVINGYGGKCACCGEKQIEFLSVDHANGDGAEERRKLGKKINSGALYRMIIRENFPDRYQILCFNCNMALGFFGYCPHRPKITRSIRKKKIAA